MLFIMRKQIKKILFVCFLLSYSFSLVPKINFTSFIRELASLEQEKTLEGIIKSVGFDVIQGESIYKFFLETKTEEIKTNIPLSQRNNQIMK